MDKSNEEEEDLYSDLPNFKYGETIDKLQEVNKGLQSHVTHLENKFQNQTDELEKYRSQCEILTKNISSLLKTAQNEIKRKDKKINELNNKVLELKTEVLKSRKRPYNNFCEGCKAPRDEGNMAKQQKLQAEPEVPVSVSMPRSVEKMPHNGEPPEAPKQVAPEIKCHTLYSQRMYNKIYNIDTKDITSSPCSDIDDGGDEIRISNRVVENKNKLNMKEYETNCVEEKQFIISRMNRSVNFSRTENVSQVHIQHYTESSAVLSSIVNKKKISNTINAEISNKMDTINDTNQEKVNSIKIFEKGESEKFLSTKDRLRNAKKTGKNIICPISRPPVNKSKLISNNKVEEVNCDKNEKEKLDIMEELFGSPVKWTENSSDDVKQATKLSPPVNAFEDSCSAHIENVKFKVESNVEHHSKTELSSKHFSYTERKCSFQPSAGSGLNNELTSSENKEISDVALSKDSLSQSSSIHWPFSKTNNEIPSKNRTVTSPTFATFVNIESTSEACDVPSTLISDGVDTANVPAKFLKSPKYNDSVLGQFDDTTQLINALAKDPLKLSPIHTPVKEAKSENSETSPLHPEKSGADMVDKELSVSTASLAPSDDNISLAIPIITPSPILTASTSEQKRPVTNLPCDKKGKSPLQTSPVEKKISIPASLILTVQKKLSIPTSVSSPVEKKFEKKLEKKTILLDKPINILCPRKTPRQIGKPKPSVTSKKQNQPITTVEKKTDDKTVQNKHDEIKPPPVNEKSVKKESCPSKVIASPCVTKRLKSDESFKKCRSIDNTVKMCLMSSEKKSRTSKSPSHSSHKPYRETVNRDKITDVRHINLSPRKVTRKKYSPIRTKSHYQSSRKEITSRMIGSRSPSRKENSPSRFKRPSRRDLNPEVFIRPEPRRESFRRPNCHFRQSSVDRKIAKDYRHYSKSRNIIPSSYNRVVETSRFSSKACDNKLNSKDRLANNQPSKIPVSFRSSRISWSDTNVVSAKTVTVNSNDNEIRSPSPPMKWVLRPIDLGQNPNVPKESIYKQQIIENIRKTFISPVKKLSPSKDGTVVSVYPSPSREYSLVSPDPSPGKAIVIVAKKRPIKFGSNN